MDHLYKIFVFWIDKLSNFIIDNKGTWFSGLGSAIIIYFKDQILTFFKRITNWKHAMGKHSVSFSKEFDDPNFKDQLRSFIKYIEQKISILNEGTNWSSQHFTPLDAEVEVRRGSSKKKKVTDLLSAIRSDNKSEAFLILGDPGSGKSVALRKLCEDLLKEVFKTNKIPIYINLKEWLLPDKWTKNSPPTSNQLKLFILEQLKGNNDLTDNFLDNYFYKLLNNGYFFIILDSFDEVPMVLDEDEDSWLIEKLSEVIYETIICTKNSRGILASRFFRKPSRKFNANTTFLIRPFTNLKIQETLKRSVNFKDEFLIELFNKRTDLIPVVRNPFAASLLSNYVQNNASLPLNQAALYESYITHKLITFNKYNPKNRIDNETILNSSKELAFYMFQSVLLGLEIPVEHAVKKFGPSILNVVDILIYARIGRIGTGFEKKFSFIHRRFNEYFVVKKLLEEPTLVPVKSIPTDSRWRDSLMLYCEIAPKEIATKIANYCFKYGVLNVQSRRYDSRITHIGRMHCLRFLADSFKSRKDCINESHLHFLNRFIYGKYILGKNLLEYKLAVETVGLLPDHDLQERVQEALLFKSSWITETAINSCRHISDINNDLKSSLLITIRRTPQKDFIRQYKSLRFSFKLSNGFKEIYQFCQIRLFSIFLNFTGLMILAFYNPFFIIIFFIINAIITPFKDARLYRSYLEITDINLIIETVIYPEFWLQTIFTIAIIACKDVTLLNFSYTGIFNSNYPILILGFSFFILSCFDTILFTTFKKIIHSYSTLKMSNNWKALIAFIKNEIKGVSIENLLLTFINLLKTRLKKEIRLYRREIRYIYIMTIRFIKYPSSHKKEIIIIGVIGGIVWLMYTFIETFGFKMPIIALWTCITLFLLYLLIKQLLKHFSDGKIISQLNKFNKNEPWHRDVIESYFYMFKTRRCRHLFVKFLYEENITAKGSWKKNNAPPYIEGYLNDDTNTLIAQLEERWLGLNR
jgi:DNA polymerase III delta prime subunit